MYYLGGKCLKKCPKSMTRGKDRNAGHYTCECKKGYMKGENNTCTKCDVIGCSHCDETTGACDYCNKGLWLTSRGECVSACETGYTSTDFSRLSTEVTATM